MNALSLLLLFGRALLWSFDPPPAPAPLILFLAPQDAADIDPRALLDTVAIYTRDLKVRVQVLHEDPSELAHAGEWLRARGARLAFWCGSGASPHALNLFVLDAQGTVRGELVTGDGTRGQELYRIVALKLRAALVQDQKPEQKDKTLPAPHATEPGRPPVAATPSRVTGEGVTNTVDEAGVRRTVADQSPPPIPNPAESRQGTMANSPTRRDQANRQTSGLLLAAGYRISHAPGQVPVHQTLSLEGLMAAAPALELGLALELAPTADSASVAAGGLSVRDFPLRLAARWVHRGPWGLAGVGPFASAHVLVATADAPAGRRESSTALAAGLGVEAVARTAFWGRWALDLRGWAEGLVPRTRFWVGNQPASDTGSFAVGVGLALVFSTR